MSNDTPKKKNTDDRAERIAAAEKAAEKAGSPTPLLSALMAEVFG